MYLDIQAQPHVFVVAGDLTHLAADAWLLPTDSRLSIREYWEEAVPGIRARVQAMGEATARFRAGDELALPVTGGPEAAPAAVLAQVPLHGVKDPRHVVPALEAALRAAKPTALDHAERRTATARRGLPLVAMPLFGARGGGGDEYRGELVEIILATAEAIGVEQGIDVVLVLREAPDLAHAHRIRRESAARWAQLGDELIARARWLGAQARAGRLVPFIGAGVSASAGLPLWDQLIKLLLEESPLGADQYAAFKGLPILDQAHVLRHLEPDAATFNRKVAAHARADHYGLAPALLAALPTNEAVTLNYDELYEKAAEDQGRPATLLPERAVPEGGRWLLKLHGSVAKPDTIVLTREDYLGYGRGREALSALAKAMLLTRHLLFVGFGLADDHFHELVHDVRMVLPPAGTRGKLGTALLLSQNKLHDVMWGTDLELVPMGGEDIPQQVRRLEIFLDCLLAHADQGLSFFLNRRFDYQLTESERTLQARLLRLRGEASAEERRTPAWERVQRMLDDLGGG